MAKVFGVLVAALAVWGCVTQADEQGQWQQVEGKANCAVWDEHSLLNATVTWTGDCVSGRADGYGTAVWRFLEEGERKESKYTGQMKDGNPNGRGVWVGENGDRYNGDWKNGKWHGGGVYVWASGARYEGDYRDGKKHGRGVLVSVNGARYEGEFRDGMARGRGVSSPLKKALLTGFHSTAKHNATKAVSPSSETMRTI